LLLTTEMLVDHSISKRIQFDHIEQLLDRASILSWHLLIFNP